MTTPPKTILISRRSGTPCDDLAAWVRTLGYLPAEHDLGSIPTVDLTRMAAAIVVGDGPAAIAQTQRFRVELGERFVPIVWSGTSDAISALRSGADAILAVPGDRDLAAAQLIALLRIRTQSHDQSERLNEVRELAAKLSAGHDRRLREIALAWETLNRMAEPIPKTWGRFQLEASRVGQQQILDAVCQTDDSLRILLAEVQGEGGLAGCLSGWLARAFANQATPGEALDRINRTLLAGQTEYLPIAVAIIELDHRSETLRFAQAGFAPAVHDGANGPQLESGQAAPLGIYPAEYETKSIPLHRGETFAVTAHHGIKLVLAHLP